MSTPGFCQVFDDEVGGGEGGGGDGLLVRPLTVDYAGVVLAPLVVHRIPHLQPARPGPVIPGDSRAPCTLA